jgi:hypothetical protein
VDDFYSVLGVTRKASSEQIKGAYRRLAHRLHPDVNPDPWAAERFKKITLAYEILSDNEKRAEYDLNPDVGQKAPIQEEDIDFAVACGKVIETLRSQWLQEARSGNAVHSDVLRMAAEVLMKSLADYEAALNDPWEQPRRPAILVSAQHFLETIAPDEFIEDRRSDHFLSHGMLGMVGLSRVFEVVGRDANPRAKEAAARAIMSALANALLNGRLIGRTDSFATLSLVVGEQVEISFAELEAAV